MVGQGINRKRDAQRKMVGTSEPWFPVWLLDDNKVEEDENLGRFSRISDKTIAN